MSPSRKSDKPRGSHATRRHGAARAAAAPPPPPPPLAEWSRLGTELAAHGPHRVAVAMHEDAPASALLEPALASLTLRRPTNAELCSGVAGWAQGFAQVAIEHALPPVDRIGAIAWLARVALREERAA